MPDWGTWISDAKGSLHNISKNAFDSMSTSSRQPLNATNKILTESFDKTWTSFKGHIASDYGINMDVEGGLGIEDVAAQLTKGIGQNIARVGTEALVGGVLAKVSGAAEGPLGILISDIITVAGVEFATALFDYQSFKPGQWVLLDLGSRPRRVNKDPKVIQIKEGQSIWGDKFIDVPDDVEYEEEAHHGIGFVMGPKGPEVWTVFSFETGNEQDFESNKIRPAGDEIAKKLDDNPEFSIIREVRFLKDHDPTMKSYLPTDPGTFVFLGKERLMIVSVRGKEYVLEGADGSRVHANADQLIAGERSNSSSWLRGKNTTSGFLSLSPDTIYSNQWVWIPASAAFVSQVNDTLRRRLGAVEGVQDQLTEGHDILAICTYLKDKDAKVVRAYDGIQLTVPIADVHGVSADVTSILNKSPTSKIFKKRVSQGQVTTFMPLGSTKPELSLGIGVSTRHADADMKAFMTRRENEDPTQNQEVVRTGASRAAQEKKRVSWQDSLDDVTNYRNVDTRLKVGFAPGETESAGGGGGMGMMLVAGLVIFVAMNYK